jgi:signal transduction histidine kinase
MGEGVFLCDIDEALLAQALINVLTNAAEATRGANGARQVRVALQRREQDIGIVVADNGCGVDEELRERIFHGFLSTKPEGGGIGLTLARQIILAHGGDLRLLEPASNGWKSEFLFSLPVLDPAS